MRLCGPGWWGLGGHQRRSEVFTGNLAEVAEKGLLTVLEGDGRRVFWKDLISLMGLDHVMFSLIVNVIQLDAASSSDAHGAGPKV